MEANRSKDGRRGLERLSSRGGDGARRVPLLKREESDIIPTSIPTQEALQNLGRYRSTRSANMPSEDVEREEEERHTQISTAASYDSTSPIIPSPTHDSSSPELPPSPELAPSEPMRLRPPLVLSSPTRKARSGQLPPPRPTQAIEDDPIMDFDDDSEEEQVSVVKTEAGVMDDLIQTMSVGSFSSISSDLNQQVSGNPHSTVRPPQSPSGKFILPAVSYQAARSVHVPPPSPSKRLRPVSEVPQPIAPPQMQQQLSPKRDRRSPSGRQSKVPRTSAGHFVVSAPAVVRSPTTPTRRVSEIGKSLRIMQPPAPLGPRLLEIAEEERRAREEQEEQAEQGALGSIRERKQEQWQEQESHCVLQTAQETGTDINRLITPALDISPFCEAPSTSTASFTETVKVKEEEPLTQSHLLRAMDAPQLDSDVAESHVTELQPSTQSPIVLPGLILEYATKLTPIDRIKWPPAKEGRFHIFGLILSVGPVEQMMNRAGPQSGQTYGKRLITMCDQSATSFKVFLWRDRCGWGDNFKPGDVALFTDMQTKEFRNKVSANSSSWSRMSRLDGTLLLNYVGNSVTESFLKTFDHQRQVLGIHLLDKESGIVSEPSLYITQPMGLLQEPFTTIGVSTRAGSGHGAGARPKKSYTPILPPSITGASIRGSVTHKLLMDPDDPHGWEVGAITADGRSLIIRAPRAQTWIGTIAPGSLMNFFGRFQEQIFWIEPSMREPMSLSDQAWDQAEKWIAPRHFDGVQSLRDHQYMGDAAVSGYILAAQFPDLNNHDNGEDDGELFGPIQSHCTGCSSAAVSSPQNPSILFCPHCHLDPQRRAESTLEWMYPTFELTIGDKPRMGGNLTSQCLQVRCQLKVGDQVFPSVPARSWMENEEGFWKAKKRWQRLLDLMNSDDESVERRPCQKVRVELRVGVGMLTKALKVEYL